MLGSGRKLAWRVAAFLASTLPPMATGTPAHAQRIENDTAIFAALDKVTARISRLEVPLNQTVQFGALLVTPRACYSRPPTEPPKTTTFVEVEEKKLDGSTSRLFSGWMFAESPGLNAVEHPVFDVWLTECVKPVRGERPVAAKGPPAPTPAVRPQPGSGVTQQPSGGAALPPLEEQEQPRRRVRR